MILRRRGDLDLVMAQLGGELFATRGNVENFFGETLKITPEQELMQRQRNTIINGRLDALPFLVPRRVIDVEQIKAGVVDHIRSAPEREAAALRNWAKPGSIINFNTAETQALAMWKVLKSL